MYNIDFDPLEFIFDLGLEMEVFEIVLENMTLEEKIELAKRLVEEIKRETEGGGDGWEHKE
ncbi:MAG: hypothetical protein DRO09_04230 [Thermoprotei archaeon]|nr:MAG: hypothetical protein DRO09_04230 [Thermoprotei archaeon]